MSDTKKISRRVFLSAAASVAAGSILAACAPQAAPTQAPAAVAEAPQDTAAPASSGGKTITYWVGWGNYAGWWPDMEKTDEFKQAIGGNTLELKGSIGDAMTTALAAGTPPDCASNVTYLDYMARGVLWPIEEMVKNSAIIKKEDYLEGPWNDAFYKGVMYGIPANEGFLRYGLNYNSKLAEAAGLDPKNPPETWSECLEWHKALTKFDSAGNLQQLGLDPYDAMGGSVDVANGFFATMSWGWKWFDADSGKFDLNNDKMAESLDVMGQFYKIAGPDNLAGMRQVEGQGGWGGSFNAEVQSMIIEGYWHPGETMVEKPEVGKFNMATWAPVPDARQGAKVQGTGGHYLLIFKDAKNHEEAFRIGEFLNTQAACDIIFKNTGWLPGLKTYSDTVDPSVSPGLDFYFRSIKEATEWFTPARCPITAFVQTQYQELREKVFRDEMKPAEAAAELQKRCESEYKQAGFAS